SDSTEKCGPPPPIANGDIISYPLKEYPPESEAEYQCQSYYKLEGNKMIVCHDGQWSKPPKCLNPCVILEDIMNKHKIRLRWKENNKLYVQSGEFVEFTCKMRYNEEALPKMFRSICIDGKITYPTCG
ncbi:complement factor H-related protein 1-like, partial [Suncus etruscus]|uniref:complement factor H-related protein 1-like n=1 Tax=Suncus etruscus TaxID=109475 RepID=UPI00210F49C1